MLAENLLLLRQAEYRGELHRLLSVLKLRFGQPDATIQSYRLLPGHGFELLGPASPAEGWLTGLARPLGDGAGGGRQGSDSRDAGQATDHGC